MMTVVMPTWTDLVQAAPAANDVVSSQSVWDFFVSGGLLMIPILICSVVALVITLDRALALRRERILPEAFDQALVWTREGRFDETQGLLDEHPSPASCILQAGLRRRGLPLEDVERGMEDQAAKEFGRLRGRLRPLNILANITPLLGLLGTVVGIQESFHRVVRTGLGRPENLASGIEVALVTTIAGLSVASPACLRTHGWRPACASTWRSATKNSRPWSNSWRPAGSRRMRLDTDDDSAEGLSLTPLIDVVFLLLIFFLVSTTFAKEEVEMDLDLPRARSGKTGSEGQYLVIQFTKEGALRLAGRKVTLEGLQLKLQAQARRDRGRAVLIRGDVDARYGLFAKVMDACRIAKLEKILIRALPDTGRPR